MTQALRRYGDRAWLIDLGEGDPVAVAEALAGQAWPDPPPEVTVGARTCLVRFDGPAPAHGEMAHRLSAAAAPGRTPATTHEVVLPVRYDGPDLSAVADACGLSSAEVIELHTRAEYRVSFLGFAPGFGYLTGLPQRLHLPRRDVPRTHVPAGSVAIAFEYSAVYPRVSPGGWHLIGHTDQRLFDPDAQPPSLLRPGTRVRFEAQP